MACRKDGHRERTVRAVDRQVGGRVGDVDQTRGAVGTPSGIEGDAVIALLVEILAAVPVPCEPFVRGESHVSEGRATDEGVVDRGIVGVPVLRGGRATVGEQKARGKHALRILAAQITVTITFVGDGLLARQVRRIQQRDPKLTRTSVWLEKLEGGIEHLREVIVADKLGIAAELEAMMQRLVDTYECEWAAVVNDPEKRKRFQQFANTDENESCIEIVAERGQTRPAFWVNDTVSLEQFREASSAVLGETAASHEWVRVGSVSDFPLEGGATVKYGRSQIAVFNFSSRGEWYATQNMCPHKKAFVLSRGIIGDASGVPKIACPLHKKTFSLKTGESLQSEEYRIATFPVKVVEGSVFLELPSVEAIDAQLATEIGLGQATSCATALQPSFAV